MDLEPGAIFEGRYEVESLIGQGAFARVYKARQKDLGRTVALKVLHTLDRNVEKVEEAKLRFAREVKVISRLNEPHTITVYDHGTSESGLVYMVTEHVEGRTLKDWMEENRSPGWEEILHIVRQVLYSLAEAHSHGIIHRDIKPANIMIFDLPGRTNQVKVLDFGIARAFDEEGDDSVRVSVTKRGRCVGTPGYMAPEQLRGEELGPQADLYAVGIIAYELVNGEPAFKTMSEFEAAALQLNEDSLQLEYLEGFPNPLMDAINTMLKKRVDGRPQNASKALELLEGLEVQQVKEESKKRATILWGVVALLAIIAFLAFGLVLTR